MRKYLSRGVLALFIVSIFAGCGRLPDEQLLVKGKKYEQNERFEEAIKCYLELEKEYPDSPLRMEAMYQAGRVYTYGLKNYDDAVNTFQRVVDEYQESDIGAQCQFMIGFIYANNEPDTAKARMAYSLFLEKYPDHDLADDVQWELANLGKDINEILQFQN